MKKLSELLNEIDFALSGLEARNETLLGLTDSLIDTFNNIFDPIGNKQELSSEDKAMVLYELLRDKNSINSLLQCLKYFIEKQADDFNKRYQEVITNNFNEMKKSVKKDGTN